jgi:predicted RNA-binding protein
LPKVYNKNVRIYNIAFDTFENNLDTLKAELKQLIDTTEKPWFAESYRLYEQEMIYETAEYILNRRPEIEPETEQFYRTRIIRYNSWQHPAIIIRPGQ